MMLDSIEQQATKPQPSVLHCTQQLLYFVALQLLFDSSLVAWCALQVKRLMHKPRVFGRTVPICQLDVDGVRMEISSIHTRPPVRLGTPAGSAGELASAGVPPDAAQILQAGPQAAVAAAAAAAAAAGGQVNFGHPFFKIWSSVCHSPVHAALVVPSSDERRRHLHGLLLCVCV
jgi:hypothetical protein